MSQFVTPNQGRYDENPTPAYVFDLDQLKKRLAAVKGAVTREKTKICYGVKANPFLVEALKEEVDYFEVCSPGEFHICEYNKADMDHLVVTGVYKAPVDVMRMIGEFEGRTIFTVESLNQLQVLDFCAGKYQCRVRVLLSLTSGNQFGMKASQLEYCISHRDEYKNLDFLGVQYYSGTQKKEIQIVEDELKMLEGFCQSMEEKFDFETEVLMYAPGLGVPYVEDEEEEDLDRMLDRLNQLLKGLDFSGDVILEMGRFLAAFCGSYYTSIGDVKSQGGQNYCIVDGGIHHLNYYGQDGGKRIPHCTHIPQRMDMQTEETLWNVCGCLCTPEDVLAVQMPMRGPSPGDLIIFERAGAYCVTEGISLHMSQDLPRVYFYSEEAGMELIRTREGTCKWNMRPEEDEE